MSPSVRRTLLSFAKVFIIVVCIIAVLAAILAWLYALSIIWSLALCFLVGGLVTLCIAAMMGSGYAGSAYYKSPMMALSSTYMDTIVGEYPQQRRGEFDSLIVGSVLGAALLGIGALLLYLA